MGECRESEPLEGEFIPTATGQIVAAQSFGLTHILQYVMIRLVTLRYKSINDHSMQELMEDVS